MIYLSPLRIAPDACTDKSSAATLVPMRVLGIESSCDETSAAVVEDGKRLLSVVTASSMDLHTTYGGVVPEIAARSHIESIIPVVEQALTEASHNRQKNETTPHSPDSSLRTPHSDDPWDQIDAIAVTYGAGLGGSLLVGVMTARTLAITKNKPLYAINHVEGHIYANFITEAAQQLLWSKEHGARSMETQNSSAQKYQLRSTQPQFPMLGLIVSGGHSQLVLWRDHFDYTLLGQTNDDAIGEAFDKVAKILGLPYPGGPSIGKKALDGNATAFTFPKAKMPNKYDFSFSGVKTAVLRTAQQLIGETHQFPSKDISARLSEAHKADIAASFQQIAVETVVDKTILAYEEFRPKSVVIGGGVAASPELRRQLAERLPIPIQYQDFKLMTDNAAMIAALGCWHIKKDRPAADPYTLGIAPNLSM